MRASGTRIGKLRATRSGSGGWLRTLTLALLLPAAPALAQDAQPVANQPPSPGTPPQLETITVTAQKRKEDVKDVPLNVSVVSGAQLEQQHIVDLTDLSRTIPGLSFSNVGGSGLNKIELRGISSDAGSPTVGVYLDEVPITMRNLLNSGATEPRFFDIDRIEVLRGPQGTLYGASSMGGTIRFISKQPDFDKISASIYSELSGTEHGGINFEENAVFNAPIAVGKSALRVGVDYVQDSGYIDHLAPDGSLADEGVNTERTAVIRAALALKPIEGLTVTPSLFFQRARIDDTSVYDLSLGTLQQQKRVAERGRDTVFVPSVTANYDLGWSDVTSVTSYFWRQFNRVQDGTYYNSVLLASTLAGDPATVAAFPNVDPTPLGSLAAPAYIFPTVRQYTQELRIASKSSEDSGQPYTWLAGLFFTDQHVHLSDQEYIPGVRSAIQSLYGTSSINVPAIADPLADDLVYSNTDSYDERQYAVFGEASYNMTKRLKATAGLRYLYARETLGGTGGAYYNADAAPIFAYVSHAYALTPKFALTYDLGEPGSLYANASKGFRLGAFNQPIPEFICSGDLANVGLAHAPASYNSDSLWSYEAGTKLRLFDNRVTLNAAGYYIDWKNVQQHIYLPTCGFDYTQNAGDAESYGTELELKVAVTPSLILSATGGYTHARLTRVDTGVAAKVGDKLLGTPDWTATIGIDYIHSLGGDVIGFARADWDWTGSSHGAFDEADPDHGRPVYDVLNGSLGIDVGRFEFSLFAKNILNQNKTIQRPSLLSVSEGYTIRPLTVGIAVSAEF